MGEAAKAAGIGPEIEHKGVKYRLKPRTPQMIGLLEMWLQQRAWDALERMRGVVPDAVHEKRSDRLMALIAAGEYSWGSETMVVALGHREGVKEAMFLAMNAEDRMVTRELVEEIFEAQETKALEAMERLNAPDPTKAPAAGQNSQ